MVKKRYVILIALVAYTAIIFLPPLMHGYVYPNNGDDTAFHLLYFKSIASGEKLPSMYFGRDMVGFPLVWFSGLTGISVNTLFLWFNFAVLWLVGVSAFLLVTTLIDWKVGLLAMPVVVFCVPSTLGLFDAGAIFDLATVGVILPLLLLCGVKLVSTRKWQWVAPTVALAFLLFTFHTMVVWELLMGSAEATPSAVGSIPQIIAPTSAVEPSPPAYEFFVVLLGYAVALLLVIAVAGLLQKPKRLQLNKESRILFAGFLLLIAIMSVLSFTDLVSWAQRIAIDLAIVVTLFALCLLGTVVRRARKKLVMLAICVFVVGGSIPLLATYLQYNSAVKSVDIEAIGYVNRLPYDNYSCSPEIAPWIYSCYLDKEYAEGELPYIERNQPMTSKTSPDTRYYWWMGMERPNHSLDNAVKFTDGEVEIDVVLP